MIFVSRAQKGYYSSSKNVRKKKKTKENKNKENTSQSSTINVAAVRLETARNISMLEQKYNKAKPNTFTVSFGCLMICSYITLRLLENTPLC